MDRRFFSLSQSLTGNLCLDVRLAEAVYAGVTEGRQQAVESVLSTWAEAPVGADLQRWIAQTLWPNQPAKRICQDIILSWTFGGLYRDGKAHVSPNVDPDTQAALWFAGDFWRLAKAHAPGIPGGYFGHWSYLGEA